MIMSISEKSSVTVGMNYRNAPAAIEWLCDVFGFKKHAIYFGPNNTVMHAELTLGGGMIMLASAEDNEYNRRFMKQPDEIGGRETRHINLIVEDADAIYERAKAAGAEILYHIEDKPYGGRAFTCRDLEGHIWNIGTYDPWQPNKKLQPDVSAS
jgi:uncharacterized glyoxalase superfamily protein PhnB